MSQLLELENPQNGHTAIATEAPVKPYEIKEILRKPPTPERVWLEVNNPQSSDPQERLTVLIEDERERDECIVTICTNDQSLHCLLAVIKSHFGRHFRFVESWQFPESEAAF